MGWPWRIYHVDDEAKDLRRQTLDRYGGYAQLSAFAPIVLFLMLRLSVWTIKKIKARKGSYDAVPASPSRKALRQSPLGIWEARFRRLQWWLEDDAVLFGQTWGRNDEWVLGTAWTTWLLFLSVLETGDGELPEWPMIYHFNNVSDVWRRLFPPHKTVRYNCHLTATASVPTCTEESKPRRLCFQIVT